MIQDKFNVKYTCGCIHEIEQKGMTYTPTRKQTNCGKVH